MLRLFNLSTYSADLKVFEYDKNLLSSFLASNRMDGIELLIDQPWDANIIPQRFVKGVHLRYWSNWLDLWRGNTAELKRQFGDKANLIKYYGGDTRAALVANYRAEVQKAMATGAEYAVLHLSNARLNEIYSYKFYYTDEEVIDAAIELVNEVLAGLDSKIAILFENLWWPGLTLTNKQLAKRLFNGVSYPHKGFMLDTGHLMNTNRLLRTQADGVNYILAVLEELGELTQAVQGIHLHYSLSGEYVASQIAAPPKNPDKEQIMAHILKIDQHLPFDHPDVQKVVKYINPQYLVYEFMFSSRDDLARCLHRQNLALGLV